MHGSVGEKTSGLGSARELELRNSIWLLGGRDTGEWSTVGHVFGAKTEICILSFIVCGGRNYWVITGDVVYRTVR